MVLGFRLGISRSWMDVGDSIMYKSWQSWMLISLKQMNHN